MASINLVGRVGAAGVRRGLWLDEMGGRGRIERLGVSRHGHVGRLAGVARLSTPLELHRLRHGQHPPRAHSSAAAELRTPDARTTRPSRRRHRRAVRPRHDCNGTKFMRVLLVYPPISKRERYCSAIGSAGGNQTPLGVFYLAAYLRQRDHQVEVIDGEARGLSAEDIVARAGEFHPELVGVEFHDRRLSPRLGGCRRDQAALARIADRLGRPARLVERSPRHVVSGLRFCRRGRRRSDAGRVGPNHRRAAETCRRWKGLPSGKAAS